MKIYLSQQHWSKLWHDMSKWECTGNEPEFATLETYTIADENQIEINNRIKLFNNMFTNLKYNESLNKLDCEGKGYWGFIEGNEKDITIFLLRL